MQRNATTEVFLVLIYVCLGFYVLGPLLGGLLATMVYQGEGSLYEALQQNSFTDELRLPNYLIQGMSTLVGMWIIPTLAWLAKGRSLGQLVAKPMTWQSYLIVPLIMLALLPVLAPLIQWNAQMDLPAWLDAVEKPMRALEDRFAEATRFMIYFPTPAMFALGMVVIAILPAVGEEFVFRGILQTTLAREFNPHVAIWVAAFLFSALHLQFYGFFPRMLLGAMFGYLYWWSGNLWIPVLAHFINNGFSLTMAYLFQLKIVNVDPEDPGTFPVYVFFIMVVIFVLLVLEFRRQTKLVPGDQ